MGRLKIIPYYVEDSEPINIPKRVIDNLNKKTIITNQYIDEGSRRELVIEYQARKGSARGVMRLYDVQPENI
ncbi:MAG: hypothetical protein Q8933_09435 [Bacteroidota bacterium]|nr:hypothetical protein [Bacteroidota bacterium]